MSTNRPPRLLFVTIPERGHVNPLIGVAQHLAAAGCDLSFFATGAPDLVRPQLTAAGLPDRCAAPAPGPPDPDHATRGRAFLERLADRPWLRRWIARLLVEAVPAQLAALRATVDEARPDLLVADPMVYAAPLAAHAAGIPWAGLSSSLNPVTPDDWSCELTDTVLALAPARARLFTDAGAPLPSFKVCDAISPWLNVVFTTEAYVPRSLSANHVSYHAGASLPRGGRGDEPPFPWDRLAPGRPLVYVSFGSQLYHQPDLFLTAARALAPEGVQLVFSVGELADDAAFLAALPDAAIAVRYAPQLALLDRADLVISHGGANSVMETLSAGRPLLLLPVCNDQPLQARLLEASGAGATLDPRDFTVERCRASALPLLAPDSPARRRAETIAASYAAAGGAAHAAELVLALARDRRPLRPDA